MKGARGADRDALVIAHVVWARKAANRVAIRLRLTNPIDELESVALEALVRVASRYQADRGVPFQSFASQRIEGAILDYCRDQGGGRRVSPGSTERTAKRLNPGLVSFVGDFDDVPSNRPDPQQCIETAERRAAVRTMLRTLPPRLAEALALYYLHDMRMNEVGARMGVTESRVCQMIHQAIQALRGPLASRFAFEV